MTRVAALLLVATMAACGASGAHYRGVDGTDPRRTSDGTIVVQWTQDLMPEFEQAYVPVERSAAAVDRQGDRIYVGATSGSFHAMTLKGEHIYRLQMKEGIESAPSVDGRRDALFITTAMGTVHAVSAHDGGTRWESEAGGPVSEPAILTEDALYLVTEDDMVTALDRKNGDVLWRYRREPHGRQFAVAGHAGLLLQDGRIYTGFGDGSVVALDGADGSLLWEVDTTLDVTELDDSEKRFLDVDTTPVAVGDVVYVASIAAGLYALDMETGAPRHRNPHLVGVTSIVGARDAVVLSSALEGLVCIDLPSHTVRWVYPLGRGAPGRAKVVADAVYVPETTGAFLAISLADGKELSRVESTHGFSAPPSMNKGRGYIISNSGRLFAFSY